ncbi:hypothetical protein ACRHM7_13130 [Chromohalobacter israelensis]|uniref:hypothetical protein n=1 Tax=Chromohalobacter israelensis TaxID=141390 RepID=UPI003D794AEF
MSAIDDRAIRGVCIFIFMLVGVVIARDLELMSAADDVYYLTALDNKSLWEFSLDRYQQWSGRTLLEGVMALTIRYPLFWKIAIPLCFSALCYQLWKLTLRHHLPLSKGSLVVLFIMLLMSGQVAAWGAWWVSGFYNYLLPTFLGVYALGTVLDRHRNRWFSRFLGAVAAVVACQQEQVAIALLSSLLALSGYRLLKRQSFRHAGIVFLLGLISAYFLFNAPGNTLRYHAEMSWLPSFAEMGLWEKLLLGLDRVNAHAFDNTNRLFLLTVVVSFLAVYRERRPWPLKPVALGVLALFGFSVLLQQIGLDDVTEKLGTTAPIGPSNWYDYDIFLSYTLTLLVYGTLFSSSVYLADNRGQLLAYAGTLTLSVAMTVAVAFSPTVYGSGARVFYLSDVLMVAYACLMLGRLIDRPRISRSKRELKATL